MTQQIVIYGRPSCCLCDEAEEQIKQAIVDAELRGQVEVVKINIDESDQLLKRFLELIPVVELEGKIVCELEVDVDLLLTRLLKGKRS